MGLCALLIYVAVTSLLGLHFTDAKIGYFWHITDLHYDPFHSSPEFDRGCRHGHGQTHRGAAGGGGGGGGGSSGGGGARHRDHREHACDSSWALLQSAAAFMAERHPDTLEFVLWTGDILSSSLEHASEELKLEAVRNVTDVLSRTFSSQFVFPALGHNDPPPSRRLVEMWMQWLPTEALQTFETGGFYTIEQSHSKLRIVVLNSNLWAGGASRSDGGGGSGGGGGGGIDGAPALNRGRAQWEWLELVLNKARRKNEMVYLVAHSGPGVEERADGWGAGGAGGGGGVAGSAAARGAGELSPSANSRLLHVVRAFSDVIAGQFYGHRHADTFRVIYSEGRPVSWAFLAPSVTPRGAGAVTNPGLRLYKFDSNTGKVLDYTQYYLDISPSSHSAHSMHTAYTGYSAHSGHSAGTEAAAPWHRQWAVEYNLTQYYALREVSAPALDALANKIHAHYDTRLFAKYLSALRVRHRAAGAGGASGGALASEGAECDAACAHVHYCAITRAEHAAFRACVRTPASALASRAPRAPAAALCLYAVLLLFTT